MPRKELSRAQMLSQFFTLPQIAKAVLDRTKQVLVKNGYSWNQLYFIECSAGDGVFSKMLPKKQSISIEIDPLLVRKHPDYIHGDFLKMTPNDLGLQNIDPSQIVVGFNPPFSIPKFSGRSGNVALEFVNRAAQFGDTVAMILPNTFRRPATQAKVDNRFHLVYDTDMPDYAFTVDGESPKVTTVFQIWQIKYDPKTGNPIPRPDDPMLRLVKHGHWGGDFHYVKSTDPTANLRVCNWGSHATVGRLDHPKTVPHLVKQNQMKTKERIQSGKTLKGFEPDNSHYYICADNPAKCYQRFAERKYLFEQVAQDRCSGNNPDLTVADVVRIYVSPPGTQYKQGKWISS